MATDADNDVLSYSASGLPLGSIFSIATRTFTWTPGSAQTGVYTVSFSVSDGKGGTATATVSITVNPPPDYTLSISSTNGSVTKRVNGVVTTATSFPHGTVVSLTAAPNTGYTFANWSGSVTSTNNPVSITMDGNKAVTANFTQNTYTLGITATNGSVTKRVNGVVTTATSYPHGTVVSLTATANTGYAFANWSGSVTSTNNPVSIMMDGNKTVTANFTQNTYTLGITATNGSVTKRVNGVVTTATSFAHGTVVSLTAAPNTGYSFANWSGSATGTANPVSITMDGNKAVTATFAPIAVPTYTVTFNLDGKGTRTGGGALIQTVAHGGTATAPTVTANTGWVFAGWDKAFNTITSNLAVNAVYTAQTYTVTFNLDGKGTRTGGGALTQTIIHGSTATAPTVTANTGWVFTGWDKAFNNITSTLTVNAQYTLQAYTVTFNLDSKGTRTGGAP